MARRLLALLASLLLFFNANAAATEDAPPLYDEYKFQYVCAYVAFMYGVKCGDIKPPVIITSNIVGPMYYGMRYLDEPYVFVNKDLWENDRQQWASTVVHETTHYVLDYAETGKDRCESEEIARRAHHSFEGSEYDDSWRSMYRC